MQCIRIITLYFFFFFCYSPLLNFILYFCPGHFSYTRNFISLRRSAVHKNWYSANHISFSHCPLLFFILYRLFRNMNEYVTFTWIDSKLGIHVSFKELKCSAQNLLLCTTYVLSYCPLLMLYFIFGMFWFLFVIYVIS